MTHECTDYDYGVDSGSPGLPRPAEVTEHPELDSTDCSLRFTQIADSLPDHRYWILLRWAWLRHSNSFYRENMVPAIFDAGCDNRECLMMPAEREALANLPAEFSVYQGGSETKAGILWSWALHKPSAKNFAQKAFGNSPRIVTGMVLRDNVIAYFSNYDESEMLIDPDSVSGLHYADDYGQSGPFAKIDKGT